ncbi:MAG: hypothetical protein AAF585_03875 [Verrucomicrobiota bacterium]
MTARETNNPVRYFAAKSDADLREVCSTVGMEYGLPQFTFDVEDDWEYGFSEGAEIAVNVTKTQRLDSISTWMDNAPKDVNFQIILYGATRNNFEGLLRHTLSADIIEYSKS